VEPAVPERLNVIVAVFDPIELGATFDRADWPAHVTLVSNFVIDAPSRELAAAVSEAFARQASIAVRFGGHEMFGRDRSVAVRLIESDQLHELHERLADVVEAMPGFVAADPDYWRAGYRAHMTMVPTMSVDDGDVRHLASVVVAELMGSTATVTATLELSPAPAMRGRRPGTPWRPAHIQLDSV
jgi:hypothetical protein